MTKPRQKIIRRLGDLVVRVVFDHNRDATYYQLDVPARKRIYSFTDEEIDDIILFAETVDKYRQAQR